MAHCRLRPLRPAPLVRRISGVSLHMATQWCHTLQRRRSRSICPIGRSSRVVSASDCGVTGHRFESHRGRLCLSHGLCTFTAVPRSISLPPSMGRWNEYQLTGWVKGKGTVAHTRLPSIGFRSWSRFLVENGASHINEYDWLLKYMTSGRLEVDLEKLNDWRRLHV